VIEPERPDERTRIERALKANHGSVPAAAKAIGYPRAYLYSRMRLLGIERRHRIEVERSPEGNLRLRCMLCAPMNNSTVRLPEMTDGEWGAVLDVFRVKHPNTVLDIFNGSMR